MRDAPLVRMISQQRGSGVPHWRTRSQLHLEGGREDRQKRDRKGPSKNHGVAEGIGTWYVGQQGTNCLGVLMITCTETINGLCVGTYVLDHLHNVFAINQQ